MSNLDIGGGVSKKLKIISIACEIPITKVCEELVDYFYNNIADKEKLKKAELKLK